jgi:hypothetical protein
MLVVVPAVSAGARGAGVPHLAVPFVLEVTGPPRTVATPRLATIGCVPSASTTLRCVAGSRLACRAERVDAPTIATVPRIAYSCANDFDPPASGQLAYELWSQIVAPPVYNSRTIRATILARMRAGSTVAIAPGHTISRAALLRRVAAAPAEFWHALDRRNRTDVSLVPGDARTLVAEHLVTCARLTGTIACTKVPPGERLPAGTILYSLYRPSLPDMSTASIIAISPGLDRTRLRTAFGRVPTAAERSLVLALSSRIERR